MSEPGPSEKSNNIGQDKDAELSGSPPTEEGLKSVENSIEKGKPVWSESALKGNLARIENERFLNLLALADSETESIQSEDEPASEKDSESSEDSKTAAKHSGSTSESQDLTIKVATLTMNGTSTRARSPFMFGNVIFAEPGQHSGGNSVDKRELMNRQRNAKIEAERAEKSRVRRSMLAASAPPKDDEKSRAKERKRRMEEFKKEREARIEQEKHDAWLSSRLKAELRKEKQARREQESEDGMGPIVVLPPGPCQLCRTVATYNRILEAKLEEMQKKLDEKTTGIAELQQKILGMEKTTDRLLNES